MLPWGDLGRLYRSPTQCSWQCAIGRRYQLPIIPTTSLPGAVSQGSTCKETNYIPVTVARAGWCSTSSLLQMPSVARLTTTCQALALNKDKTRHSPSSDRKESSNTMQPDLRCWYQHHPVLSLMHNITGLGFVPYAQHQWLAYLNSSQRQRTTAPQQCEVDLFRHAYYGRRNTAVNSPRPPTPPVYHHCVPRDLYPQETFL